MIEQLDHTLVRAGATWVVWILVGLSVLSVGVMLDRARVFWRQRADLQALVHEVHRLLSARDDFGAKDVLTRSRSSAAAIALAGLAERGRGAEAVREAMAAASGLERARLERRLLILGTIGNNAPFIGLLGTVIGVIRAFEELGRTSAAATASAQLAPEQVMSSIAEALVATALGLLVAIPAVAVFNYFQGLLTSTLNGADTLGHVVLAHVEAPFADAPPVGGSELPARVRASETDARSGER